MKAVYFKEKLSDILYRIHTHKENANIRLASQAHKIRIFKDDPDIPSLYEKQFGKLIQDIEKAQIFYNNKEDIYKFPYMRKSTAAKHIKLLMDIYWVLE